MTEQSADKAGATLNPDALHDLCEAVIGLNALIGKMQELAARYIEPGSYRNREGLNYGTGEVDFAFANDIIYMLDGPEQRVFQGRAKAALTKAGHSA